MLPQRSMREGPEEGGGDPRVGGPGEDSTSEDGGRYWASCLRVCPCGWVRRGVVHCGAPKKIEFFVPWDNDRPRSWRGPRVKNKTNMHQKLSQGRIQKKKVAWQRHLFTWSCMVETSRGVLHLHRNGLSHPLSVWASSLPHHFLQKQHVGFRTYIG